MTKALIDADSLLYKAGFSFEEKTDWNTLDKELGTTVESLISYTSDIVSAKNAIDGIIENIKFKTGCDEVELWLTGGGNFRYDIVDDYKHNRKDSRKPTGYSELWNYLIKEYQTKVAYGYEADDVVVYKKTHYPDDYFLCAIDKDVLFQTVGTHYNYGRDEIIEISSDEARDFFYFQVLAGDPVDGYKGIPNIGKVKAGKLLSEWREYAKYEGIPIEEAYWGKMVVLAMTQMDVEEEEAVEYILSQARLASMHQLKEIDKNRELYEVVLWSF